MPVRVLMAVLGACGVAVFGVSGLAGAAPAPPGQDHACIVGAPPVGGVRWSALRNPVLGYAGVGVKDQALQWSGGRWHMLFSEVSATRAAPGFRFDVAWAVSPDLVHWGAPHVIERNAASPDLVREPDGVFVVTYQTWSGRLEYRTAASAALDRWSAARPLAPGLAGRMIDAALAYTGHGVILGFKAGGAGMVQHFEIAWAPSLTGKFTLVGQPDIRVYNDTIENYEFLTVDGVWTMVATSNVLDQPFVFTLGPGDPRVPATWLNWSAGRELNVPGQPFDSGPGISSVNYEHANSAFLCVGPGNVDFLTYAGSTELTAFGGWGHARIGIARSTDLVNWQVPGH